MRVRPLISFLLLAGAACGGRLELKGELAPQAQAVVGPLRRAHCLSLPRDLRFGSVRGCTSSAGETTASLYSDSLGRVVSVGEVWRRGAEGATAKFDSLAAELTGEYGQPILNCDEEDAAWRITDRRWSAGSTYRALRLVLPKVDLGVGAFVQRIVELGEPVCAGLNSLPLRR